MTSLSASSMSTDETIKAVLANKMLTSDNDGPEDDLRAGPDDGLDRITQSDTTSYTENGNRKAWSLGNRRRKRDEEKMLKFQQSKGYTTRSFQTSAEIEKERADNLKKAIHSEAGVTMRSGSVGKLAYKQLKEKADEAAVDQNINEKMEEKAFENDVL